MVSEITIALVDDHPILRRGLAEILGSEEGFRVVGEAENGADALVMIEKTSPGVAIVDIDMPIMDGIDLAKVLRSRKPDIGIVFLTIHKDRSILRSLPSLGVSGYVLKDSATEEIVDCIRTVVDGERFISPSLQSGGADATVSREPLPSSIETLTTGELRVLALVASSRSNREIADKLFVSVRTVETHRYNICTKLGIKGPHSLLRFATKNKARILQFSNLRETS